MDTTTHGNHNGSLGMHSTGKPLVSLTADGLMALHPDVRHVTADSRRVGPGSVFVALPGRHHHGHQYIADALARGAIGVVTKTGLETAAPRVVFTNHPRLLYGHLAAAVHGYPSHALRVVAVTGTNGKTSTVFLAAEILRRAGIRAEAIGTLTPATDSGGLTTPMPEDLQALLARAVAARTDVVLVEASSHALVQHRLAGTRIAWAVVTNLARDHLDYHGTPARYWAAKRRLVKAACSPWFLRPTVGVVLHADATAADPALVRHAAGRVEVAGRSGSLAEILALRPVPTGIQVRARLSDRRPVLTTLPWPTDTLVPSLETAVAIALVLGVPEDAILSVLPSLPLPPGRMNVYRIPHGPRVVIDYAHNPEALARVLGSIRRRWPKARITAVFGGRGQRDRGKLPLMGETAAKGADRLVVTTDSPYDDDPAALATDILAGARRAGLTGRFIPDRRSAIMAAVWAARPQDVVVVTGRGHETTQHFGSEERLTGSDAEWVVRVLGGTPEFGTGPASFWTRMKAAPARLRRADPPV
jgi:UDP-N-acetylmuramoyl-L-alanyl-D-glutamate--2,6-diaminopimelate ligase